MGHALDKQMIAEGVETLEQAARLQELDCDIAQGYYFAKPMAPEALTALLQDRPNWLLPSVARPAVTRQPRRRPARTTSRPALNGRKPIRPLGGAGP
jgi:predicted signal transduction protein with EAL and GGDEF domain